MEIIYKKVQDLIPYINNSRTHSEEQVNQIVASINEFGFTNPLLIDGKDNIIAGHGRLLASKKLKMEEVPCIVLSGLTEAQKKAYIIADNKMALNAGWDDELLKIELENLKELDFDLELTGFDVDELDDILGNNEEEVEIVEDEVPEVPEEPKAKLGDIYQLGNHRLMCGDSTKEEDVAKLMNGVKADMVFTDPPYGMNLDTDYSKLPENKEFEKQKGIKGGKTYKPVIGDNEDFKDDLVLTIFNNFDYCKEIFVWGGDYYPELLKDYKKGNYIVWDKKSNEGMENNNFDKTLSSNFELCWSKQKHKKDIVRVLWVSAFGTEQEFDHKRHHPTQKPTKLSRWFIDKYSKENDLIVDIYGGSGSTLIACEQLNRNCYMMELDPHYISVIIERYINFTGNDVYRINPDGTKTNWRDIECEKEENNG